MRVLITGAAGQLAVVLARELREAGHDVKPYDRAALDVTRRCQIRAVIDAVRPDVVLNCSAYNRVDDAESNRPLAFVINADAPGFLASEADRFGAIFVHYSTDFVFDGAAARPYREVDVPAPQSVYGQSKLAGELNAAEASQHYILRLESLFGPAQTRRSTIDWLAGCLLEGREAPVFVDRVVSPSYSVDVARATRYLLERGSAFGVYHCVNSGYSTWYDLAQEIARIFRVRPLLRPVRTGDVVSVAPRPRFCALSNARLSACGMRMPTWQSALRRHLAELLLTDSSMAPVGVSAVRAGVSVSRH